MKFMKSRYKRQAAMLAVAVCLGGILCSACSNVPNPAPGVLTPTPAGLPQTPGVTPTASPSASPALTAAPSPTITSVLGPTVTPSPTVKASATPKASVTPKVTATPKASPTVKPTPTATPKPTQLDEKTVLSILKLNQKQLVDIQYTDLDGDGIKDAVVLYREQGSEGYAFKLTLSAVNSATRKHQDIVLDFPIGLQGNTEKLTVFPIKSGTKTTVYAVAGGRYGGTVDHVGYSVLQYTKSGWKDIFSKYRDNGMGYALTMENGPKATLTLENGQRFILIPTDLATYRASGWIDLNGNLTPDARVFDEHIGFSTLTFGSDNGALTLHGTQDVRGLHKLDVLARLNTVWRYDGSAWTVTANISPVSSKLQSE